MIQLCLLFISCCFINIAYGLQGKILGGKEYVESDDLPEYNGVVALMYQGSVRTNIGNLTCGAYLISSYYALSSCGCICDRTSENKMKLKKPPRHYFLKHGTHNISENGTSRSNVQRFIKHPKCKYNFPGIHYDIGLIKARRPLSYYARTLLIRDFPEDKFKATIDNMLMEKVVTCTVLGWGKIGIVHQGQQYLNPGEMLRSIEMKISFDQEDCIKQFSRFYTKTDWSFLDTQICTAPEQVTYEDQLQGLCEGDSGSPMFCYGYAIAVAAWNVDCGQKDVPFVFQRIDLARDFFNVAFNKTTQSLGVTFTPYKGLLYFQLLSTFYK